MENYYEKLKISQEATSREITKAYHKLALASHPDKGGDEEKFKEINEAYQTLSDEAKRKAYDLYLFNSPKTEAKKNSDSKKNNETLNPEDAFRKFQKMADLARENHRKIISNKELNQKLNNESLHSLQVKFSNVPEFVQQSAGILYKDEMELEHSKIEREAPTKHQQIKDSGHKNDDSDALTLYDRKSNSFFDNFNKIETKNNSELYVMHSSQTGMARIVNDNWDPESIYQSALAWKALGTDRVTFIPEGEPGAIPADLRETAVKTYETLGITVTNPPEKKSSQELSSEDQSKKAMTDSNENDLETRSIKP